MVASIRAKRLFHRMNHPQQRQRRRYTVSIRFIGVGILILLVSYFQILISFMEDPRSSTIRKESPELQALHQSFLSLEKRKEQGNSGHSKKDVTTIGIASTVTGCGREPFTEGAAVLKFSIDLTSVHGNKGGKYDYKFYIMYHPDAEECVLPLKDLGFTLLKRPTPVNVSDIQGEVLRERIVNNGCCGEKELIKLEAYRLTQHPVVIHLDLDVLVLKPMDDVIDIILDPTSVEGNVASNPAIMWPDKEIPRNISLVFTKDYNVVAPRRSDKPFQGGFFMIRPSEEIYRDMVDIILVGDYIDTPRKKGWGGKVGPFHGGMTIQGLLPWYYEYLHQGMALELNRCVYNNIADNPTIGETVNDTATGRCRTNQPTCEDCRSRPIEDIVTFHYTVCQKPWLCIPQTQDAIEMRICHRLVHEWYSYRSALEQSWGRSGIGSNTWFTDHFHGHCKHFGFKGYEKIQLPYGVAIP